ncbi:MAG: acyl-ACP--UDP-N-acetylglucosamine O-acyltransferase [Verrucomicrobiaceae bacterium]|nr:MAG: acyl-ACP--UDP-N-acetylglucosamine O-acyltransferase [Verrucomicrobiaceae bacterium]
MLRHPTALIAPTARLADDVEVGAFAIIEDGVTLGPGCRVLPHAQVLAGVIMGTGNLVDRGTIIGGNPQSLNFDPAIRSGVLIGDGNTFREHVTLHRSMHPGGNTVIGSQNFFMAGSHVGHDSVIGDRNAIANAVLLAGHVTVGNRCFLGGGSVYHQFIRVGDMAMLQGNSAFSSDVPPYCIGHSVNLLTGVNIIGLRRSGFDVPTRSEIRRLYTTVFRHPLGPVKGAAALLEEGAIQSEPARHFLTFLTLAGSRGLATPGAAA